MRETTIHIGQLVIDGAPPELGDGRRFADSTTAALQRRFEQSGLGERFGESNLAELAVPDITVPPGAGEEYLAEELARALHSALAGRR